MVYTLTNKNGGFAIVQQCHYEAWLKNPSQAVRQYPDLREILRKQTLDRGYNYADFTPQIDD